MKCCDQLIFMDFVGAHVSITLCNLTFCRQSMRLNIFCLSFMLILVATKTNDKTQEDVSSEVFVTTA